jgi:hypothetical protein
MEKDKIWYFSLGSSVIALLLVRIFFGAVATQTEPSSVTRIFPRENLGVSSRSDEINTSWKSYINKKYGFQMQYPDNWILTSNITEPDSPSDPVSVDNIVSIRKVGAQDVESQTVPIAIAVYPNPSARPASEWLVQIYGKEITASPGNIQKALAKGSAGAEGVVSFLEHREASTDTAEVGRISGGILFYSGFFTFRDSPYLYVIELTLALSKSAKPADSMYADLFSKMLLSVAKIKQN